MDNDGVWLLPQHWLDMINKVIARYAGCEAAVHAIHEQDEDFKSWLIVKEASLEKAQKIFADTNI